MFHIVCCNNVGNDGVDVDGQYGMNIWELILWDVACRRGRTEVLWALSQLMLLQVVVGLVYAPSVLVRGNVLDLMVLDIGQGMVMGRVAPSVLVQRKSVSTAPSFMVQYDEMVLALMSER